jgi:CRP-like cAMP-binding protein
MEGQATGKSVWRLRLADGAYAAVRPGNFHKEFLYSAGGVVSQWHLATEDFFTGMPEAKRRFAAKAAHLRLDKNAVIFFEDDPGDSCYYIESGLVRIFSLAVSGKESIFFLRQSGDMFGLSEVLGQHPRKANAQCLSPCFFLRVDSGDFDTLLAEDHALCRRVISVLGRRIRYLGERISQLMTCGVMERLIMLMINIACGCIKDIKSWSQPVVLPLVLTQAQIASMIGSTQPTVNELLQSLQREGLIEISRRQIRLCHPLALLSKVETLVFCPM